ncbi:hypothetical protein [Thalassobacillus cyri]|nr:hypothetical protein [Thalassobacillus cyri]
MPYQWLRVSCILFLNMVRFLYRNGAEPTEIAVLSGFSATLY